MYQHYLKIGCIETLLLCDFKIKYLIDINTTIAIGKAGGNRVLCFINHPRLSRYIR